MVCSTKNTGVMKRALYEAKWAIAKLKILKFQKVVLYFYKPTDPSSLGVFRFLFGLLMAIDVTEERGGSFIALRYGNPKTCHFPLFPFLQPLPYHYMILVYGMMWIGAVGITLGSKFRISVLLYGIPYWYLFLLDKSFWNNHSYLFGVTTILLVGSCAHHSFSLDSILNPSLRNAHVPYWNYFILKYQFFMLYFLAGLKKTDMEWLEGYSMTHLGEHWVFSPFKLILSTELIDYLIVHWFGFLLDLTVGFWMLLEFSRPVAMIFCSMFHLMNSRLFNIGMFPYVCLAALPLFCREDWLKRLLYFIPWSESKKSDVCIYKDDLVNEITDGEELSDERKEADLDRQALGDNIDKKQSLEEADNDLKQSDEKHKETEETKKNVTYEDSKNNENKPNNVPKVNKKIKVKKMNCKLKFKHKLTTVLVLTHCVLQIFLPYSHFITKGFNNWTNGLYGYSWDMMVHSWDTVLVVVKVVDNESGKESFIDSNAWALNDRWNKHGDMCLQYAECIKRNFLTQEENKNLERFSSNLSIYIDVWCSLNKRFQQRLFNPQYDLLKANWSPFQTVEWLMPVLSEYNGFRGRMDQIVQEVYSWSNESEVMFVADFPGLYLENYIGDDIKNVSVTILEGEVIYEVEDPETEQSLGIRLKKGDSSPIVIGTYHKIHTISSTPSCYMYTFQKIPQTNLEDESGTSVGNYMYSPFPLIEDFDKRKENLMRMWSDIGNSLLYIFFGVPLPNKDYYQ